jgi:hypothetical protein
MLATTRFSTLTEFGAHLKPALVVELGEKFVIETNDNLWNLLGDKGAKPRPAEPRLLLLQIFRTNPVGGPVYVNGVEPGDTIVVDIERIAVRDWGWTGTIKGFGQLTAELGDIDEDFSTVVPGTVRQSRRWTGGHECWAGRSLAPGTILWGDRHSPRMGNREYGDLAGSAGRQYRRPRHLRRS